MDFVWWHIPGNWFDHNILTGNNFNLLPQG